MPEIIHTDLVFDAPVVRAVSDTHGGEGRQLDWLPEATHADVAEARRRDARGETQRELAAVRQATQRSFSYVALCAARS